MSVYNGKPTGYKISISEEQRALLVLALETLPITHPGPYACGCCAALHPVPC